MHNVRLNKHLFMHHVLFFALTQHMFNVIIDKTATSFNTRFSPEAQDMLQDLALLDPRSFSSIEETGLPQNSLEKLAGTLKALYPEIKKHSLQEELLILPRQWKYIKMGRLEDYDDYYSQRGEVDDIAEGDQEEEGE